VAGGWWLVAGGWWLVAGGWGWGWGWGWWLVGTRSRAIRGCTSDDRVGCSASDGRCALARPALHGSTRLCRFCHARS